GWPGGPPRCARTWSTNSPNTTTTCAPPARTCPRSPTGCGPGRSNPRCTDRGTDGRVRCGRIRPSGIVNGSHHGLVELTIDPPCYTSRQPDTPFLRMRVDSLIVSLVDPDGFIADIGGDSRRGD